MALQRIQPGFPDGAHLLDPRRRLAQRLRIQPVDVIPPTNFPPDEASAPEHNQVLGDGVQGNRKPFGDVRDTRRGVPQVLQDGPTGWIGDRAEHLVKVFWRTINHVVEDTTHRDQLSSSRVVTRRLRFLLTCNPLVAYHIVVIPDTDKVFKALSDPSRRQLLDRLHANNGQTLGELCKDLDMTRQAVTKHLAVLEAANLVVTIWRGREKLHYLNPVPIGEIYERWIGKYERHRVRALHDLKKALEEEHHG